MRVTKNEITSFTSHNLAESVSEWLLSNTYRYEDESLYEGYIYKYSGEDDTNSDTNPSISTKWTKIRAGNLIAMLDNKPSTFSKNLEKIEVTFVSKGYDKLALFNVLAKKVTIVVTSKWDESSSRTYVKSLVNKEAITNLRDYATQELEYKTNLNLNIPIVHSCIVKITIESNPGSFAQCGHLVCGKSFFVGNAAWEIGLGLTSFSKKEVNELGEIDFIKRGITDRDDFSVTLSTSSAGRIKQKFKDYDALLLLFTITEETSKMETLMNFGYWEDFQMLLSGPVKSEADITIQGVL